MSVHAVMKLFSTSLGVVLICCFIQSCGCYEAPLLASSLD